jgi:nicotinamide riboside kinase
MGSTHVAVDPARAAVPCSGTQVRANPFAWWDFLAPCVRAYFAVRVVLIGAESTGKTTLAQALAAHYHTTWVPEYGRTYWEAKACGLHHPDTGQGVASLAGGPAWVAERSPATPFTGPAPAHSTQRAVLSEPPPVTWRGEEFVHIAREQCRREDAAARTANRVLICDTDAFATAIWYERYLHTASPAIEAIAAARRPHLYLLTGIDMPFVQDGTRDGERIRPWMHERFLKVIEAQRLPSVLLSGSLEERLPAAIAAIDALVDGRRQA